MFFWCAFLFLLGILAFLDSVFNMGEIFRKLNSVLFLLVSLGLMVRTSSKAKDKTRERHEQRIFALEKELAALKDHQQQMQQY